MPSIHRVKTREWARELGIPDRIAKVIGDLDAATDGDQRRFPVRLYHMRPVLWGRDRRGEMVEQHFRLASEAAQRGDCAEVWQNLGIALHVVQDTIAHGNIRIHRHFLDKPEYDHRGRLDPEQTRLKRTEQATKEFLGRALAEPQLRRCLQSDPSSG